jgi:hypothetical protein
MVPKMNVTKLEKSSKTRISYLWIGFIWVIVASYLCTEPSIGMLNKLSKRVGIGGIAILIFLNFYFCLLLFRQYKSITLLLALTCVSILLQIHNIEVLILVLGWAFTGFAP